MPVKCLAPLSAMSLILSGCNLSIDSCSSADTQKIIQQYVTEQAVRSIAQKRDEHYDGAVIFGLTKIRASLAQINIALDTIKTTQHDPQSNISSCTGQLKVTVPPPMLADVNSVRASRQQIKIAQYAGELGIENSINAFTQPVEYLVKSMGDGKAISIELKSTAWTHLLDEITTAVLLKPTLVFQEADNNQSIHQVELEAEVSSAAQEQQSRTNINKDLLRVEQNKTVIPTIQVSQQPLSSETTIKTVSPGFNCNHAIKPTDITICANSDLAVLDLENMALYKNAKVTDPLLTKVIWQESIKSKYACGTDVFCITKTYKKSIQRYQCVTVKNDSC